MRISIPIVLGLFGFATAGCGNSATNPYEQAAQEVASAAAALEQEDGDEQALDGLDDADGDSDEAADEAARGDGGDGDHHQGGFGPGGGGGRHHPRGRHHGRGHGLLLWFADLDGLEACRDLRAECEASADPSTCKDEVRACVQPILEQAFAAICEEKLAMCEAADAPERPCGRIAEHCGGDAPADDPATPDASVTPDAG